MANSLGNVTCFLCFQDGKNASFLPLGLWSQQSVVSVARFLDMEAEVDRGI